jgi:hypothetical protein
MLDTPSHGWSRITIGDWSDRCSYLTDVPFDILEAMNDALYSRRPCSVKFDAEGWEYIIVFDMYDTHIISNGLDKDTLEEIPYFLNTTHMDLRNLAKELITDIRNDLYAWVDWECWHPLSEEEFEIREHNLIELCNSIEGALTN